MSYVTGHYRKGHYRNGKWVSGGYVKGHSRSGSDFVTGLNSEVLTEDNNPHKEIKKEKSNQRNEFLEERRKYWKHIKKEEKTSIIDKNKNFSRITITGVMTFIIVIGFLVLFMWILFNGCEYWILAILLLLAFLKK